MTVLNLTQHKATPAQQAAGVVDLPEDQAAELRDLLTFGAPPSHAEMRQRAVAIARLAAAHGASVSMIGGAPFFMPVLESALAAAGIVPVYAFSAREVVEVHQPDGTVRKDAVFRHLGFVPAAGPVQEDNAWRAGLENCPWTTFDVVQKLREEGS